MASTIIGPIEAQRPHIYRTPLGALFSHMKGSYVYGAPLSYMDGDYVYEATSSHMNGNLGSWDYVYGSPCLIW